MNLISREQLRREADFRRLKTRHPICLLCAYWRHPAAIEFAHLIPRKFGVGCGAPLCSNCHRELSDMEKEMSYKPTTNEPDLETLGRYLVALGTWCEAAFPTMKMLGAYALERSRQKQTPGAQSQINGAPSNDGDAA